MRRSPLRFRTRLILPALVAAVVWIAGGIDMPVAAVSPSPYADGVVLVGFKEGVSGPTARTAATAAGGSEVRVFGGRTHMLRVPHGHVLSTIALLKRRADVRYAEPDYLQVEAAAPNDPSFGVQWAFQNTGQTVNGVVGTAGADEHATSAWSVTTGTRSVVVAEVDSGVQYTHPDLAANIWSNPGGVGGCAAGTHGYNVVASTCDPMDDEVPYNGHGTHVAGIIGAVGNNGVGVTGVNWQTTILPVKWVDSSGSGSTSQLIAALDWVIQAKNAGVNVRVVNDSEVFVGTAASQAMSDEIDLLGQNDILFVTAAGNTGQNNDDPTVGRYPCRYNRPNEICVAASNQQDALPSWANYGPTTVDLAAPGDNVYSTLRNSSYGYINGSSMASPQVAGAAALILSRGYMSATALKAVILNNVDLRPALTGLVRTGGRLDICNALPGCAAGPKPVNASLPSISGTTQQGQTLTSSTGTWTNSPTSYAFQWQRCDSGGGSCGSVGSSSQTYLLAAADVGSTIRVTVTASNAGGSTPATSTQTAVVQAASGGGTFGLTSIGSNTDQMLPDRKRVSHFQLSTAGNVTKLTMYLAPTGTSGQQLLKGVLYADQGGLPAALLGVSNQFVFHSTDVAGWYDLVFASPIALQPGSYWIGVNSGASTYVAGFRWKSVSGARAINTNVYTSGPSNPFGSATIDSEQMSIYATYTN